MNRADMLRADEIVSLWIEHECKREAMDGVTACGPSMHEANANLGAEDSAFERSDPISRKAYKLRRYYITNEEAQAYEMIKKLPALQRELLVIPPQIKRRRDPDTGRLFNGQAIAAYFGMSFDSYQKAKQSARKDLIAIDRRFNPSRYQEAG